MLLSLALGTGNSHSFPYSISLLQRLGWTHQSDIYVLSGNDTGLSFLGVHHHPDPWRSMVMPSDWHLGEGWTDDGWGFHATLYQDEVVGLDFDLNLGRLVSTVPKCVAQQTVINRSSREQSMEFSFSELVRETSTFGNEVGGSLTVGTEFETGIPFVAEGKISTTLTASYSHTWGSARADQESFSATFPVRAGPWSRVTCRAMVNTSKMEVPYTVKFKSGRVLRGKWTGVSAWGLHAEFAEKKLRSLHNNNTT